ncbi:hypothetical protein B0T26DRAFT_537810 [Lasiosphaeria miniovina]|uniref:Zn(2)-C6 fungal-type domain-containing protein n=1 Tax=Lasiosphaeria miniovina TaxID=1954250 RepID=A0AA39ZQY6_9PEZI|nr:uncharacterized protein B0T26DRAFT_537810 [Lasiosphaeria miniovina]KAK0701978.1 hypothetical protein B0T26DRAFT_537810 [Lasiosphaeria miniovina]
MSEAANEGSAARPQRPGGQARRNRMRLSCGECRAKKLGCDRNLPCQRCVRSGRPELCSFGAGTRRPLRAASSTTANHSQAGHNTALIQQLRAEVAELRALVLSKPSLAETATPSLRDAGTADSGQTLLPDELDEEQGPTIPVHGDSGNAELLDLRDRCPPGYYSQHTLFRSFDEVPQLFPFIREAADECFRPRGVSLKKIKATCTTYTGSPDAATLEALLPPQDATDALVAFYLTYLEHVHRIVHVPSFEALYASFWPASGSPGRTRHPALTVLVLCMLSIAAVCAPDTSPAHRASAPKWAHAADAWISQRGAKAKCRKQLVYFQTACLVYLAKRANTMRKKRFWNQTGALVQDAVLHRLHCDPPKTDAPYLREMKRRVWAALRELDLQNAFEYGLPTLLHSLDDGGGSPAPAPANLDDDGFGQASKTLPEPMPDGNYTRASYQALSARSWALRLDISRRLFAGAAGVALPYDEVLRYTREITQALDALPTWPAASSSSSNTGETKPASDNNMPLLVSALLQFQLKEALLALHRPHLARGSGSGRSGGFSSLSEVLCYHTARDVLVLNVRLGEAGVQAFALVREDLLVAALALVRIGVGQPGPVAGRYCVSCCSCWFCSCWFCCWFCS